MCVPGFKKDYFSRYAVEGFFDVILKHKAGSDNFYIILTVDKDVNVTTFKNVYDARGMFNKLVKVLRKVDKANREARQEVERVAEEATHELAKITDKF